MALGCQDRTRPGLYLSAAPLFGHIAGGVRGTDDVLQRAAAMRYFNETDRNADIEYLVLPDKAIVRYGIANIGCDLPRLVQRATN